jgi:exopolysaccharide biosynthesis polyprenyl glycosylphosphotransferase
MFERQSQQMRRQAILADIALTVWLLFGAYLFRELMLGATSPLLPYVALVPVIAPLWVFLLTFFGAYRTPAEASALDLTWAVVRAVATGLALTLALLFVLKIQYVSRVIIFSFAALDLVGLIGVRLASVWRHRRSLQRGENFRRVLIVGSGKRGQRLAGTLVGRRQMGIHIVGYLDPDPTEVGRTIDGSAVLGTVDDITSVLKDHVVDEVILATPRSMIASVEKLVRACEEEGVRVRIMADLFDVQMAQMTLDAFGDVPLLTLDPVAQEDWKVLIKRGVDLALSVTTLPIVLPLMAIVALVIRQDSAGPALFVQERVGLNKRRFRMYKFRTMFEGSERRQAELERFNEAEGPIFKIAKDPRVTRVGSFLRRTSLDELPQIFNVIRGHMSLVGPRPMSIRDVDLFDRGVQRKRFSVKPGMTCLWQISGRSNLPFSKWLELDLWYIGHWSLGLDVRILLKTIPAVLRRSGAH